MTRTLALPLSFKHAALWQKAVVALVGSWLLAASAQIAIPMIPVPMTMQSFAVVLIGAMCGWRLATATVVAYLAQSFMGAPFLAGGVGGPLPFAGPTAGYLLAFIPAAAFAGFAAERGLTRNIVLTFATLVAGHMIIFAGGVGYLATLIGVEQAIAVGFIPFALGTALKSGLAAAIVRGVAAKR